jgi:hypothetical protein
VNARLSNNLGLGDGVVVGPFLGFAVAIIAFVYGRGIGIGPADQGAA